MAAERAAHHQPSDRMLSEARSSRLRGSSSLQDECQRPERRQGTAGQLSIREMDAEVLLHRGDPLDGVDGVEAQGPVEQGLFGAQPFRGDREPERLHEEERELKGKVVHRRGFAPCPYQTRRRLAGAERSVAQRPSGWNG